MLRALLIAALLTGPAATIAPIQAAAASTPPTQCADTPQKKAKRSLFGGIASGVLGGIIGGSGIGGNLAMVALPATSLLSDALLKMLDCKEQQQAAKATNDAIRGGVGAEVAWKSETRANVSGVSKVTASQQLADGSSCMTVTDVVIVDGEETTVPKRMCRARGASGYAKV